MDSVTGEACRLCFPLLLIVWDLRLNGWCCCLDSVFRQGHRPDFMVRRELSMCSVMRGQGR